MIINYPILFYKHIVTSSNWVIGSMWLISKIHASLTIEYDKFKKA